MGFQKIENKQWKVNELIKKIESNEIKKPKFQRKKKWDLFFKKENKPNVKDYIKFLFERQNTIDVITFGYDENDNKILYNIDGNNRINAIQNFIYRPFDIFPEYLENISKIIPYEELVELLKNETYDNIMNYKRLDKYLSEKGKLDNFKGTIDREKGYEIDDSIFEIQKKLSINCEDKSNFLHDVTINVNIFENYSNDELRNTFMQINKYNTKMTENELLCCSLYSITDFNITDEIFKTELIQYIKEYYKEKSKDESLQCYEYDEKYIMNAYDFIVGFQNMICEKYNFLSSMNNNTDELYFLFRLWKCLFSNYDSTFNDENVNEFIEIVIFTCNMLENVKNNIFTDKINKKLFNKSCSCKFDSLKRNKLFIIVSAIAGYKKKGEVEDDVIIKNISKAILYNFMIDDVETKDKKIELSIYNKLSYQAGGQFVDNLSKKLLQDPEYISNEITRDKFDSLLHHLCHESNRKHYRYDNDKTNNNLVLKHSKRRHIKFFAKTLMFYYYKENMPQNYLDEKYSIEHIFPNSSIWTGQLDKDRIGNLVPILNAINCGRGNTHIKYYYDTEEGASFCDKLKHILPNKNEYDEYDSIIKHNKDCVKIINNEKYNTFCNKIEEIYIKNFLDTIFK